MEFQEAKEKFIQAWGTLGSSWGINRTMAQIHALLLISPEALSSEGIMEELRISRGNVNMNLRALIDWGLVHKELKAGERREFFVAEKNMLEAVKRIAARRKKRELEPMIKVLEEVSNVKGETSEAREFEEVVNSIRMFSEKANSTLDSLIDSEASWLMSSLLNLKK